MGFEDIQLGYRDGIWYRKMCHANNEKQKTTNGGRNRTTKSRKNRTFAEKEAYKYLGSRHRQISGIERKNEKNVSQENDVTHLPRWLIILLSGLVRFSVSC